MSHTSWIPERRYTLVIGVFHQRVLRDELFVLHERKVEIELLAQGLWRGICLSTDVNRDDLGGVWVRKRCLSWRGFERMLKVTAGTRVAGGIDVVHAGQLCARVIEHFWIQLR